MTRTAIPMIAGLRYVYMYMNLREYVVYTYLKVVPVARTINGRGE